MKNKIVIACLAILMAECNTGGDPNNFTVSGKITNAPSQNVSLEAISYDNTPAKVIDSGKIAADGSYKLKGVAKEQTLYLITVDNKPVSLLANDNSDIRISTDLNREFRTPYISNSDATKNIYEFLNNYRAKDSVLSNLYTAMDSVYQNNPNDSSLTVLQSNGADVLHTVTDEIKNYIHNSKSPAGIFYALNIAASRNLMSMAELDTLASQASARFKDHSGLATFKSLLTQAAATSSSPAKYPLLNQPAPDLTMNDVNGKPVSISDFKGKYLLVDFWASWCAPCRKENPNVVQAYNQYKDKNFTILGVSLDQNKDAWMQAIKNDNLNWNQMSDLKQWESAAVNTYKFEGIPFNVLIDPSGKIIAQSLRGPELEQKLAEVLK